VIVYLFYAFIAPGYDTSLPYALENLLHQTSVVFLTSFNISHMKQIDFRMQKEHTCCLLQLSSSSTERQITSPDLSWKLWCNFNNPHRCNCITNYETLC